MLALEFTQSGSLSRTGSHFVLGTFLAVLLILGMLAMHGIHAGGTSSSQSTSGADALAKHGETSPVVAAPATVEMPAPAAAPCANCAGDDVPMAANCMAAVVLAVLLPRICMLRLSGQVRAGPSLPAKELAPLLAPSVTLLCINRC